MKNYKNFFIIGITGLLAISLIVVGTFLTGGANQTPFLTSKIRAASLTYKRDMTLLADAATLPPTVTNTTTPTTSDSPTIALSPTSASLSATLTDTPTDTLIPSETASPSPTGLKALPRTGWTQNVTIMFIAASVLMFVSFIF